MGASTSAEQIADKPSEEHAEQSNDPQGQEEQVVKVEEADDDQLLHKNGKITLLNGTAEDEEAIEVRIEEDDIWEDKADTEVEQPEPAKVTSNGEQEENMEVVSKENTKEDGQAEMPEKNYIEPVSGEKVESSEQSKDSQSNEVGFKKVFKFVGFKFTVKKDKAEKLDPVETISVKKAEAEVNGTNNHEDHIDREGEENETVHNTKDIVEQTEGPVGSVQVVECPGEAFSETQKKEELSNEIQKEELSNEILKQEEAALENDKKSPESPTPAVVTETSSPFRRFFTQGWAGLRKKTSFKKSKEEVPEEVEKHPKQEEQERTEPVEAINEDDIVATERKIEHPVAGELGKPEEPREESNKFLEENAQVFQEEPKTEETSDKLEENAEIDEIIVSAAEEKESVSKIDTLVVSSVTSETEPSTLEDKLENQIVDSKTPSTPPAEATNEQSDVTPKPEAPESDLSQLASSNECSNLENSQEVLATESELLSSQERAKVQGSPLKKLFSSSGLRKLSGKKSKGKIEEDSKLDIAAESVPASFESVDATEADVVESSPSSPDESVETSPTEKPVEAPQIAEIEGEGVTSDCERKKDGITPWTSFKKLVTPKRRPKIPSESDKEDEVEKIKTLTLSSTDSAGSVENQEEMKEMGELEKNTEENKKVDSSVSWDALICVGSSKKRARKTSDSDQEDIHKPQEEVKKTEEEADEAKGAESPITSSQEQGQESPSPDQGSSPTEGDGVSTWQTFKRLVTPRRKSKTRAEEKAEETAAVSNGKQSSSEGESNKDESWVSLKKLIPGRKKKKSDAKQEQPSTSVDQSIHENTEEESEEPAVVPLAEFDAAELEKLEVQKSSGVPVSLDDSSEQKELLQQASEELIHAVTVTLIEGKQALTSFEDRSPSWISTKVAESIEHETKIEETEKIKTEITVEEPVVFSTVLQLVSETESTLINEVELTSEALTALEEVIETSFAEETSGMLIAVSTEQVSSLPVHAAASQNGEIQQHQQWQLIDDLLNSVPESEKLSFEIPEPETVDTGAFNKVLPNLHKEIQETCTSSTTGFSQELVEEHTKECFSLPAFEHEDKPGITAVQEHVEEVILMFTEKVTECIPTFFISEVKASELAKDQENVNGTAYLELKNDAHNSTSVTKSTIDSDYISAIDQTTEGPYIPTKVYTEKSEVKVIETTLKSSETGIVTKEKTTEVETMYTNVFFETVNTLKGDQTEDLTSVSVNAFSDDSLATGSDVADENMTSSLKVQTQETVGLHTDLENVLLDTEVDSKESVNVLGELQTEDVVPVSKLKQVEETVLMLNEVHGKKVTFESLKTQTGDDSSLTIEGQAEESAPVSLEVQSEEGADVEMKVQTEEGFSLAAEEQDEECTPVSKEVQAEESAPVGTEVQADEGVPLKTEVPAEVFKKQHCDKNVKL